MTDHSGHSSRHCEEHYIPNYLSAAVYRLGPTSMVIPGALLGADTAAMPSSARATTSVSVAVLAASLSIGKETNTFSVQAPTPIGADGNIGNSVRSPGHGYGLWTQPANIRHRVMLFVMFIISGSLLLTPTTNAVPANCSIFCVMRFVWASSSVLGARNFASCRAASFARAFASATIASPASLACLPKWRSPQTPIQIRDADAIVTVPCTNGVLGRNTPITSTANPAKISRAKRCAHNERFSYADWRLLPFVIEAFISPYRGTKGSRLTVWLAAIGAIGSVLALVYLLVAHLLGHLS